MTEELRKLFAPLTKSAGGSIEAILSDSSIDLDGEIIGKKFLEKAAETELIRGLVDHENKAMNVVCEWVNKRVVTKNGEHALTAEPRWFESNPQAIILKNMIEKDKAPMGISITAIPTAHDEVVRAGKKYKRWTDGKIISADFVGIPANEHARAMSIAKKFVYNQQEVYTVENTEELRKGFTEDVNKALSGALEEIGKAAQLETLNKKIDELVEAVQKQGAVLESLAKKPEAEVVAKAEDAEVVKEAPEPAEKAAKTLSEARAEKLKELNKKLPEANTGVVEKTKPDANAFIKLCKR